MPSVVAQSFIMIAGIVVTLIVMARNLRAIRFAGVTREFGLMAAGMLIWGGFLVFQLLFHVVGPIWLGDADMLRIGGVLQDRIRGLFEVAVVLIAVASVAQLAQRLGRLMQGLEQSTSALEREHHARSSLEFELKTAAETLRMARQQESEFLLGLSHELRTPLNGIIGLGSLLGNTELDADQRKLLGTLEQSAQAMLARVGAVIDLSRLRTDQVEVRNLVFSLAELVRSVEALFSPSATEKGLVFSSEVSEAAAGQFIGDSRLTKQLLSTLASLAIRHSPAGSIRMLVDLEPAGDERVWVRFIAIATELVIPPEVTERVRDESGDMREDGGIGLAICWRLATLMDGSLGIESSAGAGTVVTVRLPMRREL